MPTQFIENLKISKIKKRKIKKDGRICPRLQKSKATSIVASLSLRPFQNR